MKREAHFVVLCGIYRVFGVKHSHFCGTSGRDNTGINNTTNLFEDARLRPNEFSLTEINPATTTDPLHQGGWKRGKDPYKPMDTARFLNRKGTG